jgi:hypothetical protein
MKLAHIDRLAATVPTTIDPRQRARLHGYAEMASRCETRIQKLRTQLEQTLQDSRGSYGTAAQAFTEPNTALTLACELDTLERVQPRVDAWFTDYVAALVAAHTPTTYDDGSPMSMPPR